MWITFFTFKLKVLLIVIMLLADSQLHWNSLSSERSRRDICVHQVAAENFFYSNNGNNVCRHKINKFLYNYLIYKYAMLTNRIGTMHPVRRYLKI